jgi:polyether ionophore transport system permease protein
MTGWRTLLAVAVRRDRVRLTVWVLAIVAVLAGSAASTSQLYPTRASLAQIARGLADTPPTLAFYGPAAQLDTVGGIVMWKPGGLLLVLTGLFALLTVVRPTRADEEVGLAELTGAGAVGRTAPLLAALLLATGAAIALGVLIALGLAATGAGGVGAVGAGLSFTATGFVFAGVGAVAAQLGGTARSAHGLAGGVLGASYALRAVADGEPSVGWLAWLSPIGWVQRLQPYAAQPRWWVVLLPLVAAVALSALAVELRARRDLGAALLADRPGPARAATTLSGPLGLAWRLHRVALLAWAGGCAVLGALAGWLASSIGSLVGDDPSVRDLFAKLGGREGLADSYLSTSFGLLGVTVSAYAVLTVVRLGAEEESGRVEPLLAAAVSRWRVLGSQVAVAAGGVVVLVLAMGLACGIARGTATHQLGAQVGRDLAAGLSQAPAAWLLAAVAALVVGWRPRWVPLVWAVFAIVVVLGQLGEVLGLPRWLQDLSPYAHLPHLPAASVPAADLAPLLVLTALAAGATLLARAAYRRRDLPA